MTDEDESGPVSRREPRAGAVTDCKGRLTMTCVGICSVPRECISNVIAAATAMRSRKIGETISSHRPETFIVLTVAAAVIYATYHYLAGTPR